MTTNNRPLGVSLIPFETRVEIILHVATKAEELGYTAFFITETWSYDATVLLAKIAAQTERIQLGTSILSVWGRSAATLAMAGATLNTVSNGRFILGLGASSPALVEGLHDTSFTAPYTRLRQSVSQVKALLSGDRIPLAHTTEARPLQLNLPAHPKLSIYLGATAPKSIRLAGELCHGWFPAMTPVTHLADTISLLHQGAARAGKELDSLAVCPFIPAMVADEPDTARKPLAWGLAFYLTMMGPMYRNALSRLGFDREVKAILKANEGRRPGLVPAEANDLLEALTIYGTPDTVRDQLDPWYDAGATTPILFLHHGLEREQYDQILSAFR